jgi:hypothetical protein
MCNFVTILFHFFTYFLRLKSVFYRLKLSLSYRLEKLFYAVKSVLLENQFTAFRNSPNLLL